MAVVLATPAAAAAQTTPGPAAMAAAAPAKAGHRAARVRKSTAKLFAPYRPGGGKLAIVDPFPAGVAGRGYLRGWIEAGAELKLEQQFLAGQPAMVLVTSAADAPLALTVAEAGEQPVCRDAAHGCRWLPAFAGRYAIRLRNAGGARVRYVLLLK